MVVVAEGKRDGVVGGENVAAGDLVLRVAIGLVDERLVEADFAGAVVNQQVTGWLVDVEFFCSRELKADGVCVRARS